MTLKDIIEKEHLDDILIMERGIVSKEDREVFNEEDILLGYCQHRNGNLISVDGDSYSLNMKVDRYEFAKSVDDEDFLIVYHPVCFYQSPE